MLLQSDYAGSRKSPWSILYKYATYPDIHGEGFRMKIDHKMNDARTLIGSFLSIVSISFLLYYSLLKWEIMKEYDDTIIMSSPVEYYFNDTSILSDRLGFNVAFGLSKFDGKPDFIEDPDYGTMRALYREWGMPDAEYGPQVNALKTRRCTAEDFHLTDNR